MEVIELAEKDREEIKQLVEKVLKPVEVKVIQFEDGIELRHSDREIGKEDHNYKTYLFPIKINSKIGEETITFDQKFLHSIELGVIEMAKIFAGEIKDLNSREEINKNLNDLLRTTQTK